MEEQLKLVAERMKIGMQYNLEIEIICFALKFMKADPALSIIMAVDLACQEWDV